MPKSTLRLAKQMFLAALVGISLGSSPAAALAFLTCPGTQTIHYEPGLTNTPQVVSFTINGLAGPCAGLPLSIVSAQFSGSGQGTRSCNVVPSTITAGVASVVTWSDGTQSTVEERSVIVERPLGQTVVTVRYEIVAGRFAGGTMIKTLTLLNTDLLACNTPEGVTDVAGPITMTIIQ